MKTHYRNRTAKSPGIEVLFDTVTGQLVTSVNLTETTPRLRSRIYREIQPIIEKWQGRQFEEHLLDDIAYTVEQHLILLADRNVFYWSALFNHFDLTAPPARNNDPTQDLV